jgi:hypothetical protein
MIFEVCKKCNIGIQENIKLQPNKLKKLNPWFDEERCKLKGEKK